jgi:hypothetical protein
MTQHQAPLKLRAKDYVSSHQVSLGLFLASFGVFYLTAVIMGGWSLADWGKDIFEFPSSTVFSLLPRSFISPIFFLTSLPALLLGAAMLCAYGLRALRHDLTPESQYIAILLVVFGFSYQILGAYPLGVTIDFPWEWQKQIMSYGPIFAWTLYLLSLVVLAVGAVLLYMHSKDYHIKHPEPSLNE